MWPGVLVFFLFGHVMQNNGEMPRRPVYVLALIGLVGVLLACTGCSFKQVVAQQRPRGNMPPYCSQVYRSL